MSEKHHTNNISTSNRFLSFIHILAALATLVGLMLIFVMCHKSSPTDTSQSSKVWIATWRTAIQLVEPQNKPPNPGLSNNTLRQVVCVSLGGDSLRIHFSNEFGTSPVTMNAVHVAVSAGGSVIFPETDQPLTFAGESGVTMDAGTTAISDPFYLAIEPRTNIAITIYFGETSPDISGHPGSRTSSYLLPGNEVSSLDFTGDLKKTARWYIISGIDIMADESAAAVVVLGNSITDGKGSGTDKQNRWPDQMAIRLLINPETQHIAVLNMGIGGNEVLSGGLGPPALDRFERDVIEQDKVRWLIILEGINDIGTTKAAEDASTVAVDLIAAYQQMIDLAHAAGILVYGGTLTPCSGSIYDEDYHETARQTVNKWIRNNGSFDAVIDFDMVMRDPADTLRFLRAADTGDHLHPNEIGHQMMGKAVDLLLFK